VGDRKVGFQPFASPARTSASFQLVAVRNSIDEQDARRPRQARMPPFHSSRIPRAQKRVNQYR